MKTTVSKGSIFLLNALLSGVVWADVLLVGGATLNGDFNADPGVDITFTNTASWYNLAGPQTAVATKDDLTYDGSQNAILDSAKVFGIDTGHTISEGDVFGIGYVWRDAWNWDGGSDRVRVSLFVTDDNTLTGARTDLVVDLSETSTQVGTYEEVARGAIYTAAASDAGMTLFVAIDADCQANEYARLDNFELILSEPVTYYVAASGNNSNDGLSTTSAWQNVDALDSRTFFPGEQILFHRGDTFSGAASLLGSGAPGSPIQIGTYGSGEKPHLTGDPAAASIFRLTTNEYVEVRDLRMSNYNTNNAAVPERQVVRVDAPAGSGEITHLHFINLDIFDVQGFGQPVHEDDHRSYAIFLTTANDDANPSRFNDVLCEGCTFANIDGRAFTINDASQSLADWRNQGTPYFPSINCVFQNNYGTNIYRNMAMTSGTDGFLLQHNTMDTTVEGSAYWPYNCANTLVQYNVFKHIYASDADAYACHFDYQCINTVMQYNFGYDVEGGLVEIIKAMWGAGAFQEGAVARYNIGVDVGYRNKPNGAAIFLTGDVVDSQVYNNTVIQLSKPYYKAISFEDGWNGPAGWPANSALYNNIFYAADTASGYNNQGKFNVNGNVLSHNLYDGSISPPAQDSNPYTGDPLFAGASEFLADPEGITPADLKVLFSSSAAGNGLLVADNGGVDFFGNTVSAASAPTIGAHEYQSDAVIDSDGDKMFDQWELGFGLNPASAADALIHSDSDTLINLAEFALGGNPADGNDTGHPITWQPGGGGMTYVYPRRMNADLAYSLETCTNLMTGVWTNSGYTELPMTGVIDADFESVTNVVPNAANETFIRLRIDE